MKTFREIRDISEGMKPETEEAVLRTLTYLARKGTRGSIKAGRAIMKGIRATGRYFSKKLVAVMIPGLGMDELEALAKMGFDIPFYHPLGNRWDDPDYAKRSNILKRGYQDPFGR